jgi:hypothetical protein
MSVATICFDILACAVVDLRPDDVDSDAIEQNIAASLPLIAGLVPGLSQEGRLAVLSASVAKSRAEFIKIYGDPFGCEETVRQLATIDEQPMARSRIFAVVAP